MSTDAGEIFPAKDYIYSLSGNCIDNISTEKIEKEIKRKKRGAEKMPTSKTQIKNIGKAEYMSLFHQYKGETLCSKKLGVYANQVQSPEMKTMLTQMSANSQERANRLSSFLQEVGGSHLLG